MRYYVKSLSLNGRGKIYRSGDTVTENDFKPGLFDRLVANGHIVREHIEPVEKKAPTPQPEGKKFKVAISTAVWKRYDIWTMFVQGIRELQREFEEIEFHVFVAGSEGSRSKMFVETEGFKYIEIANDPLAAKFNATTIAAKSISPDYVLCLGSDDIIHPSLMREYLKAMREGYDFIGILDMYFWDTVSGKCLYWGGYRDARRTGHTAGAGRLISAALMNDWGWMPWENRHSRVLDNSMQNKLMVSSRSQKLLNIKKLGAFALDIKSDVNMTPFEQWDNAHFITASTIQERFKYLPICAVSQQ